MSARIEQIVEVIEEVKERFNLSKEIGLVSHWRLQAIHSIAARRGITYQTVNDKCIRQLRPDISGLPQFDSLLARWFSQSSTELKDILLQHASESHDRNLIQNAFYIPPDTDISLAQEFGFDPNDETFREGKRELKLHLTKERNRHLVRLAKESWRREGRLRCDACGFSFVETYGSAGEGFIEAHHKAPIATLRTETVVRISDLVPVCSNCHSILHRRRPWLTTEELKSIIGSQRPATPHL